MVLGLTGQTGAGKTALSKLFFQYQYEIVNADEIVHQLYDTQSDCLQAVVRRFGDTVLTDEKTLDRKRLGEIVFSHEDQLKLLESIVYPFVCKEISLRLMDKDKVLIDAPTLFESGVDSLCDFTIAVLADEHLRSQRIQKRDSLEEKQAFNRIRAQKKDSFYHDRADCVLYNNHTNLEDFYVMAKERLAAFLHQ